MLAGCTIACSSRPSVSTKICRFLPLMSLPPSNPGGSIQAPPFVSPESCDAAGRSSNKRWVSSINFVNAAGLHPQNRAFVGLCHSPAFDRNYAGQERTKLSFAFLQDRRTHHIDPQSLGKFDGG